MEQNTNEDIIMITDEDGVEHPCQILLTYHSDEFNKDYIVLYETSALESSDEDMELYAFSYTINEDSIGDLYPIESDDEYNMIDEVIDQYYADLESSEQ